MQNRKENEMQADNVYEVDKWYWAKDPYRELNFKKQN